MIITFKIPNDNYLSKLEYCLNASIANFILYSLNNFNVLYNRAPLHNTN